MKITLGQLKKLIREQVEEESALEKFHATLEGGGGKVSPLVDAAIAAVNQGKSPAEVLRALKLATDDGQELMDILNSISKSNKQVGRKLNAALDASEDRRF